MRQARRICGDSRGWSGFRLFAVALLSLHSSTAQSPSRIDLSKLGPKVGERVPDFSLKDQTGKTATLESIMGPRGAMLVFFRSADW
jgi:hypothetical protein